MNQVRAMRFKKDGHKKSRIPTIQEMQRILLTEDSLTSLRWHDPDQVQRVVPFQDSQFKNTPSGRDGSRLFHISYKSRIIDVIIKKSNMQFMFLLAFIARFINYSHFWNGWLRQPARCP